MRWQNKVLKSVMMRTVVQVSLRLWESSLLQQPRWRNGLQPWKKFSMTWKMGTLCPNATSHLSTLPQLHSSLIPKHVKIWGKKPSRQSWSNYFKSDWEGKLLTPSASCESQTPGAGLPGHPPWCLPLLPRELHHFSWVSSEVKRNCVWLFATPWSMEFSRPEYWSG